MSVCRSAGRETCPGLWAARGGGGGSPRTTRSTRIPHRASAASGGGRALSCPAGLCPRGHSEGAQIAAGAAGTAGDTGECSRGAGCASRAQWPGDREPVARYVAAVAGTGRKARTGNARPASGRARHSGGGIFSCTSWRWRGRPCCRGFSSTQPSSPEMQGRAPALEGPPGGRWAPHRHAGQVPALPCAEYCGVRSDSVPIPRSPWAPRRGRCPSQMETRGDRPGARAGGGLHDPGLRAPWSC